MQEHVCLIVPCYNEARRLDVAEFEAAAARHNLWLVFVDDGSTDDTSNVVRAHASDRLRLIVLERNRGKAEAVRQGMLRTEALPFYGRLDWIGFWDADLSTPLTELPKFFEYLALADSPMDAVIGSRVSRLGSRVHRRFLRHVLGRLFATVASVLLNTRAYDSQCGAKVFRTAAASRCFREPFVTRWLFDLEILLRLRDAAVLEYPLTQWHDVAGGNMNILPNVWRTIRDLLRLRSKYRRS
jgi:dolichyl-phosphate beta-glucosyltransferase